MSSFAVCHRALTLAEKFLLRQVCHRAAGKAKGTPQQVRCRIWKLSRICEPGSRFSSLMADAPPVAAAYGPAAVQRGEIATTARAAARVKLAKENSASRRSLSQIPPLEAAEEPTDRGYPACNGMALQGGCGTAQDLIAQRPCLPPWSHCKARSSDSCVRSAPSDSSRLSAKFNASNSSVALPGQRVAGKDSLALGAGRLRHPHPRTKWSKPGWRHPRFVVHFQGPPVPAG